VPPRSLGLGDTVLRVDTTQAPRVVNVTWCEACSSFDATARGWSAGDGAWADEGDLPAGFFGYGLGGLKPPRNRGGLFRGNGGDGSGPSDGTFRPGDELVFAVRFSHRVTFGPSGTSKGKVRAVVDGGDGVTVSTGAAIDYYAEVPFLWMEVGRVDRVARYTGGDGTDRLTFAYTVQPGDLAYDLEYVCRLLDEKK